MPAASKNLLRSAIQYLLIVVKQGTVHHLPFGIGRIHDHAIPGIDSHMRDVHVSSVWFVAPEHKVPRLQLPDTVVLQTDRNLPAGNGGRAGKIYGGA